MVIETELSWGLYSKVGAVVSLYTLNRRDMKVWRDRDRERLGDWERVTDVCVGGI